MAERVGLFAQLKFNADSAVNNMRKASTAMGGLTRHTSRMKAGLKDMQSGFASMAIPAGAVAAATGLAVKKFSDFSGQMGAVKAVLGKDAAPAFGHLEDLAKKLGASTAFTATQAAEAMENLARAGLKPREIMASIRPVLDAAAAEGMNLADAASIVSKNMRAFGLNAGQATRIADALAFVSAKTNTNMVQLQEGMKFAGPVANKLGINVEDTALALGVLSDSGIDASNAGTALKNALLKLSAANKSGFVMVGKHRVAIEKNAEGGVLLRDTFENITHALAKMPEKMDQSQAAMKLLGIRGFSVESALAAISDPKKRALFDKVKVTVNGVTKEVSRLQLKAKGASNEMAEMRLDNISGLFTKLSSAIDGVVLEFGSAAVNALSLGGGVKGLTAVLGEAAAAFQFFAKNPKTLDANVKGITGIRQSVLVTVQGILQGLRDVGRVLKRVFGVFSFMAGGANATTTRLVTTVVGLAAAFAPVALALKGTISLFKGFAQVAVGSVKLAAGALGAVGKVGGGLMKKIPGIAKFLPGVAGKLGRAVGAVESITAAPVRITNWHEAGIGGLGGLGGGLGGAGGAAGGILAKLKAIGQMNVGAAFAAAGRGALGVAKALPGMIAKFGPTGLAVAGVGAAAYAAGRLLDKYTGISSGLAKVALRLFDAHSALESQARVRVQKHKVNLTAINAMTKQLVDFSRKGIAIQTEAGGPKRQVTRALAEERIRRYLTSKNVGKTRAEAEAIIRGLESQLRGIKVEVKVQGDLKKLASATGKVKQENAERTGRTSPGAARRAAQGGR